MGPYNGPVFSATHLGDSGFCRPGTSVRGTQFTVSEAKLILSASGLSALARLELGRVLCGGLNQHFQIWARGLGLSRRCQIWTFWVRGLVLVRPAWRGG